MSLSPLNLSAVNLARLNHVLIPATKEGRDRLRGHRWVRLAAGPLARTWQSLTDEGRGLLALSLVASLVGLDVIHGQNHLLWSLCFSLLVASIAARPMLRMPGVHIDVQGPTRVGVGAEARFRVLLANDGDVDHSGLRVQLPFLPWDGTWRSGRLAVAELVAGGRVAVEATARFVERGHHHIDPFGVAALVPLGLATGPPIESRGTRFVVVPRIVPVARLDWSERPRHQQGGVALASRTGESSELLGLRAWRVGDRLRDLHAPSWARLGEPVVREYQQEYFSRVAVVLDDDGADVEEDRFEAAVSLSAGILEHLIRGETLIDWSSTGARTDVLTLGRSLAGLDQALDRLADVRPSPALDPDAFWARLRSRLERVSAVVLVSTKWDAVRRHLVDRIVATGTGVRVVFVTDDETSAPASPSILRSVRTSEIEDALRTRRGLAL